ncbi:MAG: 16S rRNA methyltransferase, partial [Candidatus Thermoplasmatota archaeon]|nr:16S rRNA methyltransferase [Candidatus Thermoplasmatota archaeon]
MLTLVLADAELELVPEEIARHPSVVKNAQKRGKRPELTLLDSSLHHQALRKIVDGGRRGRPDIAHFFLLLALDSIANSRQEMRVFVHTRNDDVITIDPETRIPRSSNRFFGLVESLFLNGAVPDKIKPLMRLEKLSLEELLSRLEGEKICLHPQG